MVHIILQFTSNSHFPSQGSLCPSLVPADEVRNGDLWIGFRLSVRLCVRPSVRPQPFLGDAWTDFFQTWYRGNMLWHTYARQFVLWYDPIWPPSSHFVCEFSLSKAITQTCSHRSHSELVLGQCSMAYMCIFIVVMIRSNMAAWQPFCLWIFMSKAITQTCLNRSHSKLVLGQCSMTYMCIFIVVVIRSNMAAWQPFCLWFFYVPWHSQAISGPSATNPRACLAKTGVIKVVCISKAVCSVTYNSLINW